MSSSKIFSGDLPELTYDIIKYLQNDFSTLHSCILVNRLWCRLAISLLWENPFSIPTENYNFIEFYLNNLNNESRSKLNEYKINDSNLLPSKTLFNYPSYLEYLNTWKFISSVEEWFETLNPRNRYYLQDSDKHSILGFKKLICMLLFKLFIENEVNLHIFEIDNPTYNSYFEDILELMLQNPNFTHNIRNLKLYISINHDSITNTSIKNRISQVINTHQILKKIVLCYRSLYLYQSLLLSNNCSNSLNTITFYYINFHGIINLDKVFDQLNVLESVHMVYCSSLNNDFIQQIVNLTKPFKLKSLFIGEMSQIESLELLLQKSSNYLENFGYGSGYRYKLPFKQQLSELVIKYCKNIKFLDLYELDYQIICLALNLIENIRQNLNYLSIGVCETLFSIGAIERSSIILRNLGQHFTFRLEYLCLTLNIKMNDFEIFLKNSQNTFIKKLLINNRGGDDILSCIKENIMKKKRVKYLAIIETTFDEYDENIYEDKELFLLKNEVKEFELYDIIIQEYSDLVIYTNTDFAKKLE